MVICAFLVLGETAPAAAEKKRDSILDLLKRYQAEKPKVRDLQNSPRVVHFPPDRCLGPLCIQGDTVSLPTLAKPDFNYQYLGPATGDVTVPAGKRLLLFVTQDAWKDLSPLSAIGPDDLYRLELYVPPPGGPKLGDSGVKHLGRLTGLKVLSLHSTNITREGLQHIRGLKSLKYLAIGSERLTGSDLPLLADFNSLETLSLDLPISDEGLQNFPVLPSLKELSVWVKNIRGPGLVHLAKLPKLEYLMLGASFEDKCKFNESGLAYLKDIPSLKKLYIFWQLPITDAGMAHVGNLARLEELDIAELPITDIGLAHLKSLSALKKLDLGHKGSRITEKGLVYLKQMKSLESLTLPAILTDAGLAEITEFDKLKHLCIGGKISDTGLSHLAKLRDLEILDILDSKNVTDTGMSHIAKLTNLKELSLNCPKLTNEGLAKLSALKSLEKLYLLGANATLSGLSHLNGLTHLNTLSVYSIKRDDGIMDIGGLTALEDIIIQLDDDPSFRDEDLACFAKLKRLRRLQIAHKGISDAGLKHLGGLTNLEMLSIGGEGVTDDGLFYLTNMSKLGGLVISGNFTDKAFSYLEQFKGSKYVEFTARAKTNFSRSALDRFDEKRPDIILVIQK